MKEKIKLTLIGTALIGIFFLTFLLYKEHQRQSKVIATQELFLANNLKILRSKDSSDQIRAIALIRLAKLSPKLIKTEFSNLLTSNSDTLRAAAVQALSQSDQQLNARVLKSFLVDKSRNVRLKTFKAIAKLKSPEAKLLLEKQLLRKGLPSEERIALYEALYTLYDNPETKEEILLKILEMLNNKNHLDRYLATSALISLAPDDLKVIAKLRESVFQPKDQVLVPLAILHLSKRKDPWMLENLEFYLFHQRKDIRFSTLVALPHACPRDLWQKLSKFILNESIIENVKSALSMTRMMSTENSVPFFKSMLKQNNITEEKAQLIQSEIQLAAVHHNPTTICSIKFNL